LGVLPSPAIQGRDLNGNAAGGRHTEKADLPVTENDHVVLVPGASGPRAANGVHHDLWGATRRLYLLELSLG
jgi:hypothetical protein